MGRGDKRSKRGKIWRGSHGNTRPKAKKKQTTTAATATTATAGN
ncbi:MAG: 30S ribosomal protein THX [Saprospiraceae bacterium]|nr:30S ribosomal protein THX [Saprospiraceae bacterium]